jgi:two-component system chemotaxis response regulator CheY
VTGPTQPVRVLIVDDAATVRRYHTHHLDSAGFDVAEASNGLEAVEAAMGTSYELFVIDLNMPKMDGLTCVQRLRSPAVGTSAPIIMVSTNAGDRDAGRAYAAGANMYLVKPVDGARLIRLARMLTATGNTS